MADITRNNLLTWRERNGSGGGGDHTLREYGRTGTIVQGFSPAWGPAGFFAQTSTTLLAWANDGYVHSIGIDGSDGGQWNSSDALYSSLGSVVGISSDEPGRVFVFTIDGGGVVSVARFNADGSDDAAWTLTPAFTPAFTTTFGIDVSRDGRYVYYYGPHEAVSGIDSDTIYRADLNAAGATTRFAAIGPFDTSMYWGGSTGGQYGQRLWGGLKVNPANGNIAVGVLERFQDGVDAFFVPITGFHHKITEYSAAGASITSHNIIDAAQQFTGGGFDFAVFYDYGNNLSPVNVRHFAWDPDGSRCWLWIMYESGASDFSSLANTADGIVKAEFWGDGNSHRGPALWIYGPVICSDVILFGADNGFIEYHRMDTGSDTIVWTGTHGHDFEDEIIYGLPSSYTDPSKLSALTNTSDTEAPMWSHNSGQTWTVESTPRPSGYTIIQPLGKDGSVFIVDENGIAYGTALNTTTFEYHLFKSTDSKITAWTEVCNLTAIGGEADSIGGAYLVDGRIWWIGAKDYLHSINTDGTGYQAWLITYPSDMHHQVSTLWGYPGTDLLMGWTIFGREGFGAHANDQEPLLSIDISTPSSPVMTFGAWNVLGSNFYIPHQLQPVTHEVVLMSMWDGLTPPNEYTYGGIYRSTDSGITWTNVLPITPHFGSAVDQDFVGFDNEGDSIAINATNHDVIAAGSAAPYGFSSSDMGLTWTEFTVDLSIFDAVGGGGTDGPRPHEWCSLAITHVCGLEPGPGPGPGPSSGFRKRFGVVIS